MHYGQFFVAGLAVAGGLFWATMLTAPPVSQAASAETIRTTGAVADECSAYGFCP